MYTVGILFGVAVGVLSAIVGGLAGVGVLVLGVLGTTLLVHLDRR